MTTFGSASVNANDFVSYTTIADSKLWCNTATLSPTVTTPTTQKAIVKLNSGTAVSCSFSTS